MTAANFDIGWEAMIAIVAGLIVLGVLAMALVVREPRSHNRRLRVGIFLERDHDHLDDDIPDSEWPTQH